MSDKDLVQKLREATGGGVMECKKALDEAGGDLDKAIEVLRARGVERSAKRAGRETGAGLIYSYVHSEKIGVLVDLRAETDFVVRSEPFRELAKELALQIAAAGGETPEEVLEQDYIKDGSKKVKDLVTDVISRTGENIRLNAVARLEL